MLKVLIVLLGFFVLSASASFPLVYAQNQTCPDNWVWSNSTGRCITCWEVGQCAFTTDPLGTMLLPFERIFGGLSIVVFWGLMISIIWLRTQNPMLVGLLGTAMTAAYLTVAPEAPENEFDGARLIGGTLFAVSIAISIYHLISSRIYQPPQ